MQTLEGVATVADKKKPWLWEKKLDELAADKVTEPTRTYQYDYYMIYWLCALLGKKSGALLKPIVRAALKADYEKHKEDIERLQQTRREEEQIKSDASRAEADATSEDQPATKKPKKKQP